jgi:hypothetical protein
MAAEYYATDPARDFTLGHYRQILRAIKRRHKTYSFKDAHWLGRAILDEGPFVIMRHDVEISLRLAQQLALTDAEEGIQSTFFLLMTSEYQLFDPTGIKMVSEILSLGHNIGLHYDAALFGELGANPRDVAQRQIDLMETFFRTKVYAMSSHRPMRSGVTFSIPGVVDVYDDLYVKDVKYITDSSQRWRDSVLTDLLDQHDRVHFLSHEFWSEEGHSWATLAALEAGEELIARLERAKSLIRTAAEGVHLRGERDRAFFDAIRA